MSESKKTSATNKKKSLKTSSSLLVSCSKQRAISLSWPSIIQPAHQHTPLVERWQISWVSQPRLTSTSERRTSTVAIQW